MAEIVRCRSDPRAPFLDRRSETDALHLPHAVRRQVNAGADFAEFGGLFVNRYGQALGDERVGGEQAADTAAHDCNVKSPLRHRHTSSDLLPKMFRTRALFTLLSRRAICNTVGVIKA